MWEFIKVLIFGATLLVTSSFVRISDSWTQIHLSKPIQALNSGASLEIDVTTIIAPTDTEGHDALGRISQAEKIFPKGCIDGRLVTNDGHVVSITNVSYAASAQQTFVELSTNDGIPTNQRFSKLFLRASCPIARAKVFWRNSSL